MWDLKLPKRSYNIEEPHETFSVLTALKAKKKTIGYKLFWIEIKKLQIIIYEYDALYYYIDTQINIYKSTILNLGSVEYLINGAS